MCICAGVYELQADKGYKKKKEKSYPQMSDIFTQHIILITPTVDVHWMRHWRQGYLRCFGSPCQMPFVGAPPSSSFAVAETQMCAHTQRTFSDAHR